MRQSGVGEYTSTLQEDALLAQGDGLGLTEQTTQNHKFRFHIRKKLLKKVLMKSITLSNSLCQAEDRKFSEEDVERLEALAGDWTAWLIN